ALKERALSRTALSPSIAAADAAPMKVPVSPGCHTKEIALLLACGLNHSAHAGVSCIAAAG
ncbi:hypothetical protein, partial [Achromobacter xylosoxidans]|uniref:hypothetical protein n=1 Tax=Alcaligenes xylosoxydans xylosoxydans TaxID=85698 RepID=UPI001A949E7A